jgi:hypothetical protein
MHVRAAMCLLYVRVTEEQQRVELSKEQHKREAALNKERRKQERRAVAEARAREEDRAQKVNGYTTVSVTLVEMYKISNWPYCAFDDWCSRSVLYMINSSTQLTNCSKLVNKL